jgi:hypothetical protein
VAAALGATLGPATPASLGVDFNREIRPILSDHCYACHGPDANKRKASLRLDQKADVWRNSEAGPPIITPRQPEASDLIRRITTADAADRMPPAKGGKPLSPAQIDTLRRWIQEGAVWQDHWAYIKPLPPPLPAVTNRAWPRGELDHFVLARLEQSGLQPSRDASRPQLIRRVSLDLTGLPPTIEEVDAFLADTSPRAYERVVDRLLESQHYGERMALFWLDLARYADSQGYHHDNHRDLYHWRDWVIKAFNDNLPFDKFTTEQLAGDLLPNATREQRIATGFHRNEMTTSEGGAMPEEYAVKYVAGRVDTTARVWLGTSLACAECHDHKYDPISQKEYYQFFAYFNTIAEDGLDASLNPAPKLALKTKEHDAKLEQFNQEIAVLERLQKGLLEQPHAERDAAESAWADALRDKAAHAWSVVRPASATSKAGATLVVQPDDSILAGGALPAHDAYEVTFRTEFQNITGLRLEVMTDERLPKTQSGRGPEGEFILTELNWSARPARSAPPQLTLGPWHLAGPFPAASAKEAFDKAFGPEQNSGLDQTYSDGKIPWTQQPDWTDGSVTELPGEPSATYLLRTMTAAEPQLHFLELGSDDGLQVWLNGRRIHSELETRRAAPNQARLTVRLRSGENRLLLKISNAEGPSAFYFAVAKEQPAEQTPDWAAAVADPSRRDYGVGAVIDKKTLTGWSLDRVEPTNTTPRSAYFRTHEPFGFEGGTEVTIRLRFDDKPQHALGRFRLAITTSDALPDFFALPDKIRSILARSADRLTPEERIELKRHYRLTFVTEVQQFTKVLDEKRKERDTFDAAIPVSMVMGEMGKPRDTFFLVRGEFNNRGDQVLPGVPARLMPLPDAVPPNRLGLAQWLTHPDHPLVSRVTVNHFWQQYFGAGLVRTAEDFGSQGEPPTHPELLDWLATTFIRSGWNVKAMQRLIVTSATYRQDSKVPPEGLERDPDTRWLSRFPRLRLEAEAIRDQALAVSGLLSRKIGGPSVYPYQPPGLWEQVAFEDTRKYIQSEGADNYRRGIYTYWRRSMPYPSLVTFDAPTRETCTVRRPRTNTPLQALVLMNDPVYVEMSRALGQRILRDGGTNLAARAAFAVRLCLARAASDRELELVQESFRREFKHFEHDRPAALQLINVGASKPPSDVDICELAAWTAVSNILLNLDELLNKG